MNEENQNNMNNMNEENVNGDMTKLESGTYMNEGSDPTAQSPNGYTQETRESANPEPQPMPSSDNVYRFQNVDSKTETPKKKKSQGGMGKTIVSAIVFGIFAAVCFLAVIKLAGVDLTPNSNTIDSVNTSDGSNQLTAVSAASGSAAGAGDVSGIVENVMPSIVAITETKMVSSYFGQTYPTEGAGSGFIVKEDEDELLIVTNNHVVEDADSITVTFIDETTAKATVKGTDAVADLAVLTVKLSDLKDETRSSIKVASLGHSEDLKVGQMAIAIGNALGYGQSVTVGYLSALNREVEVGDDSSGSNKMVLLQTDAAINPGNSGGALLDAKGNVIGINTVKYADTTVEGIGYAIPMSDAITIINELMNREVLNDDEKGYLGITGRTISEDLSEAYGFPVGVYVSEVSETGAAKAAGIKSGDVITKINDTKVSTIEQVQNKVNNTKAGTEITVTIARSQEGEYKEQEVKVTLKSSETLNELDDGTNGSSNSQNNSGSGSYGQGSGGSYGGQQIVPW